MTCTGHQLLTAQGEAVRLTTPQATWMCEPLTSHQHHLELGTMLAEPVYNERGPNRTV